MFSAALVIFREVFEIVLIIGVVLAATRDMKARKRSIAGGIALGIFGSIIIAFCTGFIANLAHGAGQEVMNASILFIAAGFIGWTVLWMQKHAKTMKAKFTKVGFDISEGNTPFYVLSFIIAMTILREGTEIILFTYGMLASGQDIASILSGAAIGGSAGLLVGVLLYAGLVKIPLKHFFRITSWMLILLVAGMSSQAVGFLISAGIVPVSLSQTVWDSSFLISNASLSGKALEALLGYTSKPAIAQIIAYIAIIASFAFTLRKISIPKK
jgi:high-affinity iron transporter